MNTKITIKLRNIVVIITGILSVIITIYYILNYSKMNFHSDSASMLLLAKEQIAQKKFFPDDFCYSTGIFVFNLNLFITPLMCIVKDWLLCRELAVIITLLIVYTLSFFLFKVISSDSKMKLFLLMIFFSIPLGQMAESYYEAAYLFLSIYEILIFIALSKAIKKQKTSNLIMLGLAIIMANVDGTRNLIVMVMPLLIAVVVVKLIENNMIIKFDKCELKIIITIVISAMAAVLIFYALSAKVDLVSNVNGITFKSREQMLGSWNNFLANLLSYYNTIGGAELLSLQGISLALNFALFIMTMFFIPIYLLKKYNTIKNYNFKIFLIYSWISNIFLAYMMLFTTADMDRYIQTAFWHNSILAALFLAEYLAAVNKVTSIIVLSGLILAALINHGLYFSNNNRNLNAAKDQETIYEYLEQENLNFGYSSYWNAYNNMALSNGKVTIAAWKSNPTEPFYWLTSKKWYQPEFHKGRTFILLNSAEAVDEKYYNEADDIKYFKEYVILVYEENIYSNPKLIT